MNVLINIYKKKVQTKDWRKKKNSVAIVATVPLEQIKRMVAFTHSPNKCHNIFTKHLFLVVVDLTTLTAMCVCIYIYIYIALLYAFTRAMRLFF